MSDRSQPAKLALLVIVFVLILIIVIAFQYFVLGTEITDLLYQALFIIALFTVGFLQVFMPALGKVINKGIGYYISFLIIYIATFLPGMAYFVAAKWVSQEGGSIINVTFFVLSGILWLGFITVLFPSRNRTRFFGMLSEFGWLAPFIFVINFVFISLVAFGFFAFQLFGTGPEGTVTSDNYLNLFGYHLLESVPGLKINQTLRINEPFAGERPFALGIMILVFKLAVLIPSVGVFRAYWKARSEKDEQNSAK